MNKEIGPAPHPKEALPKYEKLLSETTTGAQALLLLGIEPPKADAPVVVVRKEELLKSATDGIPKDQKKRLTDASFNESDEYWKDTPVDERMNIWRKTFTAFLDEYTKDGTKRVSRHFSKQFLNAIISKRLVQMRCIARLCRGTGKGMVNFLQGELLIPTLPKLMI
jgi:hypothetical protein